MRAKKAEQIFGFFHPKEKRPIEARCLPRTNQCNYMMREGALTGFVLDVMGWRLMGNDWIERGECLC
jgi:hypothetical protein